MECLHNSGPGLVSASLAKAILAGPAENRLADKVTLVTATSVVTLTSVVSYSQGPS